MSTQAKQIIFVGFAIILIAFTVVMLRPQGNSAGGAVTSAGPVAPSTQPTDQALQQQIAALQEQLQKNPKDLKSLVALGNALFDTQQFGRAADAYGSALELDANDASVRVDLGLSYFYQGMSNQAIKEFRQAAQIDPNKVEAHYNLALALSHSAPPDLDGALQAWQQVVKLAPNTEVARKAQAFIDSYQKQQK